jgi:hypothetical protein
MRLCPESPFCPWKNMMKQISNTFEPELEGKQLLACVGHLKREGNSKSSDEYELHERIMIHPMTKASKMSNTFEPELESNQ